MHLLSSAAALLAACILAQASGDRDHRDQQRASLRHTAQQHLDASQQQQQQGQQHSESLLQQHASAGATQDLGDVFVFFGDKTKAQSFCKADFVPRWWAGSDANNMWLSAALLDPTKGITVAKDVCDSLVYNKKRPTDKDDKEYCAVAAWEDTSSSPSVWRTAPVVASSIDPKNGRNIPRYAATRLFSVTGRGGQRWGPADATAGSGLVKASSEWPNRVDKTTFGDFNGFGPKEKNNHYVADSSDPSGVKLVADVSLPVDWPALGDDGNSRGHLIANMLADRKVSVTGVPKHFITKEISGATFFPGNFVPTYQPFDGNAWGGFETSTALLLDNCWTGNPDAEFYYVVGPSIALRGFVGDEVVSSKSQDPSLDHMLGWPESMWGIIIAHIPNTAGTATRTATVAIVCENRHTLLKTYGAHPCKYVKVDELQSTGVIDFDPVPGLTDSAARDNNDPEALLPLAGEVTNFGALHAKCKANSLAPANKLFGLGTTNDGSKYQIFKAEYKNWK